jgi:hypothetical protein
MTPNEKEANPYAPPQSPVDVATMGRFYTPWQICLGALLGGPLAAGYFYSRDHILFGSPGKARTSLILGGVLLCCLFAIGISFPPRHGHEMNEMLPPAMIAGMYRWFAQKTFDETISLRRGQGWTAQSWWRVVGLATVGLILTLAISIALFLLLPDSWTADVIGQDKTTE